MKLIDFITNPKYKPLPSLLLLCIVLAVTAGGASLFSGAGSDADPRAALQEPPPPAPTLIADPGTKGILELSGRVEQNMPFRGALLAAAIDGSVADTIQHYLSQADFDFRKCLPGQKFTAQVDSTGRLEVFTYRVNKLRSYWILRDSSDQMEVLTWELPVDIEVVSIAGSIEYSVHQALMSLGELPQLVADYADVLGYDIDFIFDPRVGDTFRILVEKKLLDGDLIGYGNILAAEFDGELTGRVTGYRYDERKDLQGYFAPSGENLQKAFMRSPLSILRVTSGFGIRRHPISGKRKMHTGIDYAAPRGTAVWAVGSGTVVFAGSKGGYGKTIEVKHSGSVKTRYGHLSKIFVRKGQAVRQHQTIGAVGSTGYSTGPHLHFEYLVNGKFTQPRKVKNPSLKRLPAEAMDAFTRHMQNVDSVWNAVPQIENTEHAPPPSTEITAAAE